jgi:uncharacterized protein YjcR
MADSKMADPILMPDNARTNVMSPPRRMIRDEGEYARHRESRIAKVSGAQRFIWLWRCG